MTNFDNFSISLQDSKPKEITFNGSITDYNSLVGTPIWDKVNNIISLANGAMQFKGMQYTGIVSDTNYKDFVKHCKDIIYKSKHIS